MNLYPVAEVSKQDASVILEVIRQERVGPSTKIL
jgi:hypothetical protein